KGALAAECARDVGRYFEMHEVLFANQSLMATGRWGELGLRAGVGDTIRLVRCIEDQRHLDVIRRDIAAAEQLGANGKPAVLFDSLLFAPPPSYEHLDSLVSRAVARQ